MRRLAIVVSLLVPTARADVSHYKALAVQFAQDGDRHLETGDQVRALDDYRRAFRYDSIYAPAAHAAYRVAEIMALVRDYGHHNSVLNRNLSFNSPTFDDRMSASNDAYRAAESAVAALVAENERMRAVVEAAEECADGGGHRLRAALEEIARGARLRQVVGAYRRSATTAPGAGESGGERCDG